MTSAGRPPRTWSPRSTPTPAPCFAANAYNAEFAGRTAFFHVDDASRSVSGDRTEFIGRNGTLRQPAAMLRSTLSGRVGGALDPCAAIQVAFALDAGQEREIVFRLGAGRDRERCGSAARPHPGCGRRTRTRSRPSGSTWNHTLGAVNVETPDAALNTLANGWLLYQTMACSPLGAERLLPVGRRVRVPRPAAGRDGARPRRGAARPPAPAAVRVAAVPRRRRPALVASACGPGRPHALLGRLPLAAAGDVPLRDRHRRHRGARRDRCTSSRAAP